MANRPKALGRGLGALLGEPSPAAAAGAAPASTPGQAPFEIPVDSIDPNPEQPRRHFDDAELGRLADSIERHGVLQPIVVRRAGDRFELVVGERRWRAARRAGRTALPAVVADVEPRDRLELALVENVQRDDLNPIELALAFQQLLEGGHTQEEVGRRVGMDRSSVANHVRLLDLAPSLQADVEQGRLSVGHAKALLQLANPERRLHLRDLILREGLSVRDAEARARGLGGAARRPRSTRPPEKLDADTRSLVETLSQRLQTRVRIARSGRKGRIEIDFYGPEDLERLVSQILEAG